ncbi:hypothetical protein [Nocardia brasiliensis]|uniref:hypothetical protein n=1 Tax=Nocardia brasiliensis TaxID=37326 RepID=UPI0024556DFB|nr:hypothetical protein [Nocardia brasiliensis]
MSGVKRTVRMGSMAYIDAAGKTRRADNGAVVLVHPDHVERFDRLNKPQVLEPAPAADTGEAEPEPAPFPEGEPSTSWTVPQLQAFAEAKGVDLGDAKLKADILALIVAANPPGAGD